MDFQKAGVGLLDGVIELVLGGDAEPLTIGIYHEVTGQNGIRSLVTGRNQFNICSLYFNSSGVVY